MILVHPDNTKDLAAGQQDGAWTQAGMMVQESKAIKLSQADMQAVHNATSAVVLLSGSGDWPP